MRDVGRKYRSLSEELKKEVEAAKLALEKRVDEGQQSTAASGDSDIVNELRQQVEKLTQVRRSGYTMCSTLILCLLPGQVVVVLGTYPLTSRVSSSALSNVQLIIIPWDGASTPHA